MQDLIDPDEFFQAIYDAMIEGGADEQEAVEMARSGVPQAHQHNDQVHIAERQGLDRQARRAEQELDASTGAASSEDDDGL